MNTNKFKESLERYKRIFPKACEGKSDVEILLYRNVITKKQADEMLKPKIRKIRVKKSIEPKLKRIRPYTSNQISKMCKAMMKDFIADFTCGKDIDENVVYSMKCDAAYEMAEGMLMTDERMKEYFRKSRVEKRYWKESLADYFV